MSDIACAPPIPNPDLSGIGVCVSFYLQYVLAGIGAIYLPRHRILIA